MKTTGIIRRIDDLGWLVIPKELRRSLRIKNGESLEIFVDGEDIILKKYSPMESIEEAARREIKEETGLDLVSIIDILPPCFSAVGLTNERNVCVFCTVKGEINSENAGLDEEIEAVWVSKQEFSELLKQGVNMAARTQMFGYLWVNGGLLGNV